MAAVEAIGYGLQPTDDLQADVEHADVAGRSNRWLPRVLVASPLAIAVLVLSLGFMEDGRHAEHYFDTAAVIIAFLLLGRFFEDKAEGRASAALRALLELGAKEARLVVGGVESMAAPVLMSPSSPLISRCYPLISVAWRQRCVCRNARSVRSCKTSDRRSATTLS